MKLKRLLGPLRRLLGGGVPRRDVLWCYRRLLGREPESEEAVLRRQKARGFRALVEGFVESPEFQARAAGRLRAGLVDPGLNEALAMAEFRAGVLEVASTPRMLTLETSSRCNLRCVMCPHAIGAVDRPKHLEEALAAKLETFLRQARSVQLHGIGEPLASPAFWASLAFIPQGCDASINTNLTVLDERRLQALLDSGLRVVNVSLDAARPETYWKIRGHSFEAVLGNIRRLVEARRARGARRPLLYLNMTLMRSNIEELPEFVGLAAELGADALCLWHLNRWPEAEMRRYVVERGGWVFDYAREGLWNFPALSNRHLRQAEALAREKGLRLYLDDNKTVYFDEEGETHG